MPFFLSELENRLLLRFDAASQRRELSTMAECAKILSQVSEQHECFLKKHWNHFDPILGSLIFS